jgi:SAM-dependent methyltransferase
MRFEVNNQSTWSPSKYVQTNRKLKASRDPREVAVSSRLAVDLIASHYQTALKQHAQGRLLDLGCGKVPLFAQYKAFVDQVVCADWGNSLHKNHYLDCECDLTLPLPFKSGSFNTVLLSEVLEHIPTPEPLCKEIGRILAPKGKVLIGVPFYYAIHEHPRDYYRYTEFALRRLMELSRLEVIELQRTGGALEVATDIFAKNAVQLPVIGEPLAVFSQWFASRTIATSFGSKLSRATAYDFPFEYFLVAQKS